jgi:peptidoglycan/xylan/chitin deacetylase (PgdA/CDA1 family)
MYNFGAFAPFHRANRDRILILTYHRFSLEKTPFTVSAAEFSAHLEYLSKHSRVFSLAELNDFFENEKTLPPNAAVVTIDDGYSDAFEIAFPVLKKYAMPATIFAVTDFLDGKCWLWTDLMRFVLLETKTNRLKIEFENRDFIEADLNGRTQRIEAASRVNSRLKKLPNEQKNLKIKEIAAELKVAIPDSPSEEFAPISWRQARAMDAENVRIESHTVTHPILTNINQTELDFELKTSKQRLENVLDRKVEHFCYPNGSLDENIWQAVKNVGYKSAVTTEYGFNENAENPFLLKRIDAPSAIENFAQSASGFEAMRKNL